MSSLTTVVNAALLAVKNKDAIHYTQNSPARWEGIHVKLIAAKGQFPKWIDCSSFATWCLWQALGSGPDTVNGTSWQSGYTGTLAQHGHAVSAATAQPGDLVFYGSPIYHVAVVIGRQNGVLLVASHGEESGPYVVKYNQWGVNSIRRYLPTVQHVAAHWPFSSTADLLGNWQNPSDHVHGGSPQYDPPTVAACVVDVHRATGVVLKRPPKLDTLNGKGVWGLWAVNTDVDWLAVRRVMKLGTLTNKTMSHGEYLALMAHAGYVNS